MAKRGLIILNPTARNAPEASRLRAAFGGLEGWEVELETTAATRHATELARTAALQGLNAVVACGGDGTVNEVLNGLAGSHTALAVVRAGTANVWAKEARIPRKPEQAARLLADGEQRVIDLGLAGERYFLTVAGVGFDAEIVRRVSPWLKRRIGAAAYVVEGLRYAVSHRAVATELRVNGAARALPLHWLLLGNTRSYGGLLSITDRALVDDGRLDYCLVQKGGLPRLLWLLPWLLLHRHHTRAHVLYGRHESLELLTPGLPVEVDGEYHRETPMTFRAAPNALRVIVPRGLRSPLFSAGGPAGASP